MAITLPSENKAVIFDGDDTLWSTEDLYDRARQTARGIVDASGLDGARWEELQRHRDVANVRKYGHGTQRFPTSCVEAYDLLCGNSGVEPDATVSGRIRESAESVFREAAPLFPHARHTLEHLRACGVRLALVTKGDERVQRKRLTDSGLADVFDVVLIVEEKTAEVLSRVLSELGVRARNAFSVGNSIRSDLLPALDAGLQPLWIDAHVWEYERHGDRPVDRRIRRLDALPQVVDEVL